MKRALLLILLAASTFDAALSSEAGQGKLMKELEKYAIVYDRYQQSNMPIQTGNAEIGGLTDPLGRGIFNVDMANLWQTSSRRSVGPGMMLKIARFSGLNPTSYLQEYDLVNGILSTRVTYPVGAYHSELFFSQANKELLVYAFTNDGAEPLTCNIDFGLFDMDVVAWTDTTISFSSRSGAYTELRYDLRSNVSFSYEKYPVSKDVWFPVAPKQRLEIVAQLKAGKTVPDRVKPATYDVEKLREAQVQSWKKNWSAMGVLILPEGEYARLYYRSLHWLQCVAGSEQNLPGEEQFATFTSRMASEYNYFAKIELNHFAWYNHPFTYGAAGWSAYAYLIHGDRERAGKMLANFYRPEALKGNVNSMFPVGEYEFIYNGKGKGKYQYLKGVSPEAMAFAHELHDDGRNFDAAPWDKQVHIQGYAPTLFNNYARFFETCSDTAYAVMKGAAEFWSALLNYEAKAGRYSVPPLLSLTEDLFEKDPIDALQAAKWALSQAAATGASRNKDPELQKKWRSISDNIRLEDRDDVYLEYDGDDGNRRGGGYMGIRGYIYLGFPVVELMPTLSHKKVSKSLDKAWERNRKGEGMITFIANWFALTDAYWGRGDEAYEKSAHCLTELDASRTALSEQYQHLHYFLTGSASFTMVPVAMVLQSVGDEVRVFPAVPEAFRHIEFYDLPAVHGLRVSGVMKNGNVQEAVFTKNGKELLKVTEKAVVKVTIRDGIVEVKRQ